MNIFMVVEYFYGISFYMGVVLPNKLTVSDFINRLRAYKRGEGAMRPFFFSSFKLSLQLTIKSNWSFFVRRITEKICFKFRKFYCLLN